MTPAYKARAMAWADDMRAGMTQIQIAARDGLNPTSVSRAVRQIDPLIVFNARRGIKFPRPAETEARPAWSIPDAVTIAEARAGHDEIAAALAGRKGVVGPCPPIRSKPPRSRRLPRRGGDPGGRLYIRLRQQKTGALVEVPVHTDLAPLLRDRMQDLGDGMLLLPSPTGRPWAYRNFARAWDAQAKAAGVADRQRRDMRRTAVVRLAEAGATVPQLAAVTGWAVDYCQRIVDTYLPQRTETALIAIELWEGAPEPQSKVVGIGIRRK